MPFDGSDKYQLDDNDINDYESYFYINFCIRMQHFTIGYEIGKNLKYISE